MELLAPVGSKESFITAIRAGADAVYIGVPDFNARIAAANINMFDLKVLLGQAREKGVKVYLALNTLIKHEEINDVIKKIALIEKLSPDAVIVQDLGLASIIKNYFPAITLHASTQMAVHSRPGVDFLAQNGFKRAIMARELTFSELKIIANGSPIGLEVFCHGALCFSLSGMCLFSSFIGGLSGNRGRCTQPCRRLWQNGKNHGYVFSPKDLELLEHINKLKKIGIAALKIEGRMRSSEYVYRVVKAYRMLIDAKDSDYEEALSEAKKILSLDMAREKTTCLFSGRDTDIFQPKKAQCLGNLIGSITDVSADSVSIELIDDNLEIIEGDRLRLSNPEADLTVAFKIKEFKKEGLKYVIPFGKAQEFNPGNPVFKTVDTEYDQQGLEKEIDVIYENYKANNPKRDRFEEQPSQVYTALISNKWKEIKNTSGLAQSSDTLWIRFDDLSWMDVLQKPEKNSRYVFYLTKDNLHLIEKLPHNIISNLTGELPPFIGQRELEAFKQGIDKMVSMGINKWVLNNISQIGLFGGLDCELSAGQFMYTWNAYTAAFLSGIGIKYFTSSWEDDFLNVRKMCGPGLGKFMVVYLYGLPPLARSRLITKEMISCEVVKEYPSSKEYSRASSSFMPVFESGLLLLLPEKPVNIFTARRKFKDCGISNFGIDLNFIKPDKKLLNSVMTSYNAGENIPGTDKFNFKRGVK